MNNNNNNKNFNEDEDSIDDEDLIEKLNRASTDSVDTLELLKESDDFNEIEEEIEDEKTISNSSTPRTERSPSPNTNQTIDSNRKTPETTVSSINLNQSSNFKADLTVDRYLLNSEKVENEDEEESDIETADLAHLEAKLRNAWIKMRKLDKKLNKVCKKERQVKRETLALMEKNRAELDMLRVTSEHKESKQESENTAHFLALSYVDLDDEIESLGYNVGGPSTPLFKTQLPEMDENESEADTSEFKQNPKTEKKPDLNTGIGRKNSESNSSAKTKQSTKSNEKKEKKSNKNQEKDKNFIKRNIQLAQDAGGTLAMTDEEKQRLNELLLDNTEELENGRPRPILSSEGSEENPSLIVEYNPSAISLAQGDGFTPDKVELDRLRQIETKLEKRNFSRMLNSGMNSSQRFSVLSNHTKSTLSAINSNNGEADAFNTLLETSSKQIKLNDEFDENELGDKFIREARISREQESRLKFIDTQLAKIKSLPDENSNNSQSGSVMESESENASQSRISLISEDQLKMLLEECSTESSNLNSYSRQNKLELVKEEDESKIDGSQSELIEFNEDLALLNDEAIKSLLDQARNEGIVGNQEVNQNEIEPPVYSFYEEALEIIKSRPQFNLNFDITESDEQAVPEEKAAPLQLNPLRPISSKSRQIVERRNSLSSSASNNELNNKSSNDFLKNNFLNKEKILPVNKSRENTFENAQEDGGRNSSLSTASSTASGSFSLPKIGNRFLPK